MLVLVCCLLAAAAPALCVDCVIDNTTPDMSWEATLYNELNTRCRSSRYEAPSIGNATVVTLKFILKNFFFDAGEEAFSIYSWMFLVWSDPRLAWNPKDYGDIYTSQIFASSIWTPMLKLRNSKDDYEVPIMMNSVCHVNSEGKVVCVLRTLHEIVCIAKLSDWPYDTQICRFEFGNKDIAKNKLVFTFGGQRGVSMWGAEYGPGWNIIDYKQGEEDSKSKAQIYFELTLERQAAGLGALTVAPALALSALTLAAPLLDERGYTRAPLAALSLLGHFTVLQIVNYSIPQHSRESPTILKYIQWSLFLTIISIILTFLLNHLSKKSSAPAWVALLNVRALSSPLRYMSLSRWSADTSVADAVSKRHETEWLEFVSLCNSFTFLIFAVTYCTLYFVYIPQPPPLF